MKDTTILTFNKYQNLVKYAYGRSQKLGPRFYSMLDVQFRYAVKTAFAHKSADRRIMLSQKQEPGIFAFNPIHPLNDYVIDYIQ